MNYFLLYICFIILFKNIKSEDILNITEIIKTGKKISPYTFCNSCMLDNLSKNVLDYGQIEVIPNDYNKNFAEFLWKVNDFWELVNSEQEIVFSTRFYTTRPGYRLQMMLIPNTTYSDNQGYLGTFFRIVTGIYDQEVDWPYKMKTVLTVVQHSRTNNRSAGKSDYLKPAEGQAFTVVPNTDPCRLRSAFLRPSADQDFNPNPDGCGNRRHLALNILDQNRDKYFKNNTLWIKLTILLTDYGTGHETAKLSMKYNQLVSYYEWTINDYMRVQNQSLIEDKLAVLTSEPFYTHKNGYLMQLFLTLLPKRKAFAVSLALAQGDYDRSLQWPFPYKFEVAIIDQSPHYWKRDYAIQMHPSTTECGSEPFFQPSNYPDFCFITVQSMELLTLTHYNFVFNNTLKISFLTKLNAFSMRRHASLLIHDNKLIAEYTWLIPAISGKLEKFDLIREKPRIITSEEFYTNGQGYLCQIILSVNRSESNDFSFDLELSLLEGEYDSVLEWPFNKTYELSIERQNNIIDYTTDQTKNEFTATIVPNKSDCSRQSFQKPIERNPPCGQKSWFSYSRLSRAQDFLKTGNLLVKIRVYLNDK